MIRLGEFTFSIKIKVDTDRLPIDQQAYQAYGEAVAWKNYRGDPMPRWADLPEAIRLAWKAAAEAASSSAVARALQLERELK